MDIESARLYALSLPHATEDQAYGSDWVLFRIGGKIFMHIWLYAPRPTCAVKLPPEESQPLREQLDGIAPAYHLNKLHWNDLCLPLLDDELVRRLIRESYELVCSRLPRRAKAELGL